MDDGDIVLDAYDAYYFDPPIILEGDSLKNLGQWKGAAKAYWGFTVPEYGTYDVTLVYSRADGPEVRCILEVETRTGKNKWKEYALLARDLSSTGEDDDDRSKYVEYFTSGFYDLPAGTELRLSLYQDDILSDEQNFINLASITLQKRTDASDTGTLDQQSAQQGFITEDGFREPLTGAMISLPEGFKTVRNYYPGYEGMVTQIVDDWDNDYILVGVEESYVKSLDEAFLSLNGGSLAFVGIDVLAFEGNSMLLEYKEEYLEKKVYTWLCLLDEESILSVTLMTNADDHAYVAQQIQIDFAGAEGEIGLIAADKIPVYDESSPAAGIWHAAETDRWLYCPGGLLFTYYDGEGTPLENGYFYDSEIRGRSMKEYWQEAEDSRNRVLPRMNDKFVFEYELYEPADKLGFELNSAFPGVPKEGVTAVKTPEGSLFRGRWENDTHTINLTIYRGIMRIRDDQSQQFYSYTENSEGYLEIPSEDKNVRITDDGGLAVDGYTGVFYRLGEGLYSK
ncbi:MAG: hypothetical protein GXY60_08305 [Spirochaetales bacterium]|nr:hypothetical protein [Spirochaetales bacterium]